MSTLAEITVGRIVTDMRDAARDLERRAAELRDLAGKIAALDGQNLADVVDPRKAFHENVNRAYDDASRQNVLSQSRTSSLNVLVGAFAVAYDQQVNR